MLAPDRTACLACMEPLPAPVVSLGATPLANRYLTAAQLAAPEQRFPLELVLCAACGLVQLSHRVDPQQLFGEYAYLTGMSATMARHHERLVRDLGARVGLGADDLVVDVASNDGSLLQCFKNRGVRTLGVEPAQNLAAMSRTAGIATECLFFGAESAIGLRDRHGPVRLVTANNVLAHVPDLLGFLRGVHTLLAADGVASFEVPYLLPMLQHLEYDTIYHEHLSYFSVAALAHALGRAGLAAFAVEHLPVHGGTIRVLARRGERHGAEVDAAIAAERPHGLDRTATWQAFAARVADNRRDLRALLERLRSGGRRVAAYGAPAKGNTLLNYCGVGPDLVEYTVDRNPLKVGRFTPGMHLPIRPQPFLAQDRPDHALILPWNLTDEIVQQEAEYVRAGGRFVVPIPMPRVL